MGYSLDKYQMSAVMTDERNALIVAAPGSGKTTVIINRVNHLVSDLRISNNNIIVITFTKAAALNMKSRYIERFNKDRSPFFGTFHGLFYKMLINSGRKVDIIESSMTYKIVTSVLNNYFDDISEDKVKEAVNSISLYKTSKSTMDNFESSFSKEIFENIYEKYEEYKKEYGKWDFDDLALEAIKMLQENEHLLNGYRRMFKYILVDEFQDCDEIQIEFLKLINDCNSNSLFAVGDEDQCIYSFRGSKPQYMVDFDKMFTDGKKYYLSINYRSKKNIVDKSKDVIKLNKERNVKKIEAKKEETGIIKWFNPYNEKSQAELLADIITKNYALNIPFEKNAVLYRTNMESASVIDVLTRKNIPFTLLDREYNFFDHFICQDIIAYLRLSVNSYDKECFFRIINKPFRYVGKSVLAYVKNYNKEEDPFDILMNKDDMPPFQKKKIDDLKKDIAYLNKISLASAISYIVTDLGYIDYLKTYAERLKINLNDLEDVVEEFKLAADGFKTIFEFLKHVSEVKESIDNSKKNTDKKGVILSTIHGVKGMEFKNVFIINICEDTIPHASSKDTNLEEERRLFYVGMTRAIDELYLFSPRNRRGQLKDISRFIIEGKLNDLPVDTYGFKKGDEVSHCTYGMGEIIELDKDKVNIRFSDGIERSFSLKVLVENNLIENKL